MDFNSYGIQVVGIDSFEKVTDKLKKQCKDKIFCLCVTILQGKNWKTDWSRMVLRLFCQKMQKVLQFTVARAASNLNCSQKDVGL